MCTMCSIALVCQYMGRVFIDLCSNFLYLRKHTTPVQYLTTLPTNPHRWGERSEPHTCGENGKIVYIFIGASAASPTLVDKTKICLYIYIFIYIFIYIYMVRTYSVYTSCPICARCKISTLHVCSCNHCCSREKTSRTERLNSGKQRNRNLKTVRKGRHYYLDGG